MIFDYKFEIGDLVKFITQIGFNEPFIITGKGFMKFETNEEHTVYQIRNSQSAFSCVIESHLVKFEKDNNRFSMMNP